MLWYYYMVVMIFTREGVHFGYLNYRRRLVIFVTDCLNDALFRKFYFRKKNRGVTVWYQSVGRRTW